MTSLRNIEPKLVVKLQPFGTERVNRPRRDAIYRQNYDLR